MSEIRQDALTPLRLYARGFQDGFAKAATSQALAVKAQARMVVALEQSGFDLETIWDLWAEATHRVEQVFKDQEDPYVTRWLGAELLLILLAERC